MQRILIFAVLGLILLLGASIGYFNAQVVEFNYLAGQVELPLMALLVANFFIAVFITLLICIGKILCLKNEIRRLNKQIKASDEELKSLRDLPLPNV